MAKLRIRHVRETLARLFYRYAYVPSVSSERERDREGEWKKEGEEQKEAKERARGQHYPAIKSLG